MVVKPGTWAQCRAPASTGTRGIKQRLCVRREKRGARVAHQGEYLDEKKPRVLGCRELLEVLNPPDHPHRPARLVLYVRLRARHDTRGNLVLHLRRGGDVVVPRRELNIVPVHLAVLGFQAHLQVGVRLAYRARVQVSSSRESPGRPRFRKGPVWPAHRLGR